MSNLSLNFVTLIPNNTMIEFMRTIMNTDTGILIQFIALMASVASFILAVNKTRKYFKLKENRNNVLSALIILIYLSIGLIIPIGIILLSDSTFFIVLSWFSLASFFALCLIIYKMDKIIKDTKN